ncbi:MAG: hypothetical protein WCO60_19410 [Verrucomicrobiota bacterium]
MKRKLSIAQRAKAKRIADELSKISEFVPPDAFAREAAILASALRIFGGTLEVFPRAQTETDQPPTIPNNEGNYDLTQLRFRLEKMDPCD